MSRHIDFSDLTPEDLQYLDERPWLKSEYELQSGAKFDDLLSEQGVTRPPSEEDSDEIAELKRQLAAAQSANTQQAPSDDYPSYASKPRPDGWENFSDEEKRDYVYGSSDDSSDEDTPPYDEWEYSDLLAEVSKRNEDIEDEDQKIKPASRKQEDVIAALEADDKASAE